MWLALWSLCLIFKIYAFFLILFLFLQEWNNFKAHRSIKFDLNLYFNYEFVEEFEEEKLNMILRHMSWYMNIMSLIHSKGIFRKKCFPIFS